jgi:ribosome-binding protein aMBF1 (putative translation factor)
MSDHFEQHLDRIKRAKGKEWAEQFDGEYERFVKCVLIAEARQVAGLSVTQLSGASGVSRRIIAKIEEQDMAVSDEALTTVSEYLKRALTERCVPARSAAAGLGDLVARCRAAQQFSVGA